MEKVSIERAVLGQIPELEGCVSSELVGLRRGGNAADPVCLIII